MAKGFVDALKKGAAELTGLEKGTSTEFLRLLKQLRDELYGRLSDVAGPTETLKSFKLRAMLAEAETSIMVLEEKASHLYDARAKQAVDLAIDHVGEQLDSLASEVGASPFNVSIDAAKVLADPAQGLLAQHFESSVQRYGIDALNRIRQRLFIGLRAGDSHGQIVRDIAGERGAFGKVGRDNAERMVRNEVAHAYSAAKHEGIVKAAKKNPSLKKMWLVSKSGACEGCGSVHMKVLPVKSAFTLIFKDGRKERRMHPPGHPNCRCSIVAVTPALKGFLLKQGYIDPGESVRGID